MVVFWRAKCRVTGRELKFRTKMAGLPDADAMREWVGQFFRNLDLQEYAPWDEREHGGGGGILYPVPVQHVMFDVPKPDLARPDRTRVSALITRAPTIRRHSILTPR